GCRIHASPLTHGLSVNRATRPPPRSRPRPRQPTLSGRFRGRGGRRERGPTSSWSPCLCESKWRLPMNLVGADVRRLCFPSEIHVSLLTSAPANNRGGSPPRYM